MSRPLCVLGAGSWGTALAALASGDVVLWCRRSELAEEINATRRNARYTGDMVLPERLVASASLERACAGAAVVLVAVPSAGFRAVVQSAAGFLDDGTSLLSLTKGLERGTHATMTEVLRACAPGSPFGVLTGPNLAKEIALGMPAACVVATGDEATATLVQTRLHSPRLRVYSSADVVGCEVAGVTKNVLAIAAGVSDGLGFGDNTRATIITRGLAEMSRLAVAMGGLAATVSGLAGVGDLVATCTSDRSRNRRVGIALGQGRSLEEALEAVGEVAEGVVSAQPLVELASSRGVELPICEQVAAMVTGASTPAEALAALTSRPARGEWDRAASGESG
jgi:glycerol-3-phosphate dehydrogenase (NAD(P)+)